MTNSYRQLLEYMKLLPDGKVISLMSGPRRIVSKQLSDAARSEWTRRVNERTLNAALEREDELIKKGD